MNHTQRNMLLAALFISGSCGHFGQTGRYGGAYLKESGIYCQYPDGPLPRYIVIDSSAECQNYDEQGNLGGRTRWTKYDDCYYYQLSTLDTETTHFGRKAKKLLEPVTHPCSLALDATTISFEPKSADSYKATRQENSVSVEEVDLVCKPFSIEGRYDNTSCDTEKSSNLTFIWERTRSASCLKVDGPAIYCFEFYGMSQDEISSFDFEGNCSFSSEPTTTICSGSYTDNYCEFTLSDEKRIVGWHNEGSLDSEEEKKEFCDRLKRLSGITTEPQP